MRYYYPEHLEGYERLKAEGKSAWDEMFGSRGFDDFASRSFLETVLPSLSTPGTTAPTALEYGCGTGPGACLLAKCGFQVDAIDLVPTAIEIAQKMAAQRGFSIHFEVADVCELPDTTKQYNLIVDSYCLQCIVIDDHRQRVFSAVRSRLKAEGYYLVSTAIMDEEHKKMIGQYKIKDPRTGIVYTEYGTGLIDTNTGIALYPEDKGGNAYADAICIEGRWYLPGRRHLRLSALEEELDLAGFEIVIRPRQHAGSMVCKLKNEKPNKRLKTDA